jgi:hypothetical protein
MVSKHKNFTADVRVTQTLCLSFENAEKLLERVRAVPRAVEQVTLQPIMLEQMERLRKCIAINGKYVE